MRWLLCDAARVRYIENGGNLTDAIRYSEEVHKKWIEIFGSLDEYAHVHASDPVRIQDLAFEHGIERTLISLTDDEGRAIYFATFNQSERNIVAKGTIPQNFVYKQTLESSTESEYLIINGTKDLNSSKTH